MRILHINVLFNDHGGAERILKSVCRRFEGNGHHCAVLTTVEPTTTIDEIPVLHLPASYGFRSARRARPYLESALSAFNPDIVHLHNTQFFFSPWLTKLIHQRYPVVKTVHDTRFLCAHVDNWKILPGGDRSCNYPIGIECFRQQCLPVRCGSTNLVADLRDQWLIQHELKLSRQLDRVMAPSEYMAQQLRVNAFPKRKIQVLPWFVDDHVESLAHPQGVPLVLFVGRLTVSKGPLEFIDALSLLPKNLNWMASIVGDGELSDEIDRLLALPENRRRINRYPSLEAEDLAALYEQATIVVVPSLIPESFGLVGIEAMARGCAVVAYDAGGVNEWLEHAKTGLRIPRGDTSGLARAIERLIVEPSLARHLALAGQRVSLERFGVRRFLYDLLSAYQQALKSARSRSRNLNSTNGH